MSFVFLIEYYVFLGLCESQFGKEKKFFFSFVKSEKLFLRYSIGTNTPIKDFGDAVTHAIK